MFVLLKDISMSHEEVAAFDPVKLVNITKKVVSRAMFGQDAIPKLRKVGQHYKVVEYAELCFVLHCLNYQSVYAEIIQ